MWCFVSRQGCITGVPMRSALVPLPSQHLLILGLWKKKIIDLRRSFPVFQIYCLVHICLSPALSSYESPLPPPAPASLPQAAPHETAAMFLLQGLCTGRSLCRPGCPSSRHWELPRQILAMPVTTHKTHSAQIIQNNSRHTCTFGN